MAVAGGRRGVSSTFLASQLMLGRQDMATATLSTCQLVGDPKKEPVRRKTSQVELSSAWLYGLSITVHPLSELLMRIGAQALQSRLLRAEAHSLTSEASLTLLPPPGRATCTTFKC